MPAQQGSLAAAVRRAPPVQQRQPAQEQPQDIDDDFALMYMPREAGSSMSPSRMFQKRVCLLACKAW